MKHKKMRYSEKNDSTKTIFKYSRNYMYILSIVETKYESLDS